MLTMVLILIFAAFAKPAEGSTGLWPAIFAAKWYITAGLLIVLGFMLKGLVRQRGTGHLGPVHLGIHETDLSPSGCRRPCGRFHAGQARACRPDSGALYPEPGRRKFHLGQSFCFGLRGAHVFCHPYGGAHSSGAYGCRHGQGTGLVSASGGSGPSLPNMLVIGGVMGVKKTAVFCIIIVILSTIAGMSYGLITG